MLFRSLSSLVHFYLPTMFLYLSSSLHLIKVVNSQHADQPLPYREKNLNIMSHMCVYKCGKCVRTLVCVSMLGSCMCDPRVFVPACPAGSWGPDCVHMCSCHNEAQCSTADGHCSCSAGWNGPYCSQRETHTHTFQLPHFSHPLITLTTLTCRAQVVPLVSMGMHVPRHVTARMELSATTSAESAPAKPDS